MSDVTRRSVLIEALEIQEAQLSRCSVEGKKLIPLPGMKELFREQLDKCRILREMIQALESEPVRNAIAGWQRDVMAGKQADVTILDRMPPETEKRMVF